MLIAAAILVGLVSLSGSLIDQGGPHQAATPQETVTDTLQAVTPQDIETETLQAIDPRNTQTGTHWAFSLQDTEVEDVLNLMLNSHEQWETVQGESTIVWHRNGETQTYSTRFAFQLPDKVMVTMTEALSYIEKSAWISDGEHTYEINLEQKTYSQNTLPAFAYNTSHIPNSLAETRDMHTFHHPLGLLTPAPVSEYVFPQWVAQGSEVAKYELVGVEKILGRDAWVMTLTIRSSFITAWIDQETGVILKYIQEDDGVLWEDFKMNSVQFDAKIPEDTFTLPGDLTRVEEDY
ncbi:MAG: hypothetical protein PVF83_10255 [Anaerolineales bacterium]